MEAALVESSQNIVPPQPTESDEKMRQQPQVTKEDEQDIFTKA